MRSLQNEEYEMLEAVKVIVGTMPLSQWNIEIMRLFWGWFSSGHSQGLSSEQQEMTLVTVRGLTDFFNELAAIEGRKEVGQV
jgi:hypothetical protein